MLLLVYICNCGTFVGRGKIRNAQEIYWANFHVVRGERAKVYQGTGQRLAWRKVLVGYLLENHLL